MTSSAIYWGVHPLQLDKETRKRNLVVQRCNANYVFFEYQREELGYVKLRRKMLHQVHEHLVEADYDSEAARDQCSAAKRLISNLISAVDAIGWKSDTGQNGPDDYEIVTSESELAPLLHQAAFCSTQFVKNNCIAQAEKVERVFDAEKGDSES